MILTLPKFDFTIYSYTVTLDNKTLIFTYRYNGRGGYWTLDLADESNEPILTGLKIVLGVNLIEKFIDDRLPSGGILAVDVTDRLARIGERDLFERIEMVFVSQDEIDGSRQNS
jgi:hypothetical protein